MDLEAELRVLKADIDFQEEKLRAMFARVMAQNAVTQAMLGLALSTLPPASTEPLLRIIRADPRVDDQPLTDTVAEWFADVEVKRREHLESMIRIAREAAKSPKERVREK